jgi:hypothetical protein
MPPQNEFSYGIRELFLGIKESWYILCDDSMFRVVASTSYNYGMQAICILNQQMVNRVIGRLASPVLSSASVYKL